MSYFTAKAEPIIAEIIKRIGTKEIAKLYAALDKGYPFGNKESDPWLDWKAEVKRQLRQASLRTTAAPSERSKQERLW